MRSKKHFWCKKFLGPKKSWGKKNFGSKRFLVQQNFWLSKMAYQNFLGKKLGPKINCSKKVLVQKTLGLKKFRCCKKNSCPPKSGSKTFGKTLVRHRGYIAGMYKCPLDKCCLDKCRGDSCNLLYMFKGPFV